jgi:hypothetical protein
VSVLPDSDWVGGPSSNDSALSSLQAPGPVPQKLDVRLRTRSGGFSFLSSCTLRDLTGATSSLRINVTSFPSLRLHVDRGLERHGYLWVPTDQGPRGPCLVDPTCQKPRRPASGPGDLIHNPGDLGRPRTTSSRLRKTCQACDASFSARSRWWCR